MGADPAADPPPTDPAACELGSTAGAAAIIQIHPTLACNLACAHCYSTSGPQRKEALDPDALIALLPDTRIESYDAVGVSGGEPLMYPALPRLLERARALGYFTSVTTNALMLSEARLTELAPFLSLLAISLDGEPDAHDRMRGAPGAFARMKAKLDLVRASGVSFGFIFTLTWSNLHELSWAAAFAAHEGASLLQVHPLEAAGRAAESRLRPPDARELSFGFLEVARLQREYADRLVIQYDVLDRAVVRAAPARAFAGPPPAADAVRDIPLARLLSPIVVQADGRVVPLQYGFDPRFALGRIGEDAFAAMADRYRRGGYHRFLDLARGVWAEVGDAPEHLPFVNWYAAMTRASAREPVGAAI